QSIWYCFSMRYAALVINYPAELIRINMQAKAQRRQPVLMYDVIQKLKRRYGRAAIYHGFSSATVQCLVQTVVTLTAFEVAHAMDVIHYHTHSARVICSFLGGIASTPFAKVSIRKQTDIANSGFERLNYSYIWKALQCMYWKGGMTYTFYGWKIYSTSCAIRTGAWIYNNNLFYYEFSNNVVLNTMISTILTGALVSVILTPLDVLVSVTLNSSAYKAPPIWTVCRRILKRHGFPGFFVGWKLSALSVLVSFIVL
ncbi:hypothetical protein KR018_006650, partial [Drosophila ironensis]